jgi:transcriptional regulator GlxA family with amidase domain
VVVTAFDGVRCLDVIGPLEVFAVANEQGDYYAPTLATPRGDDVVATTGTRLRADMALEDVAERFASFDTLLVPGAPDWRTVLAADGLVDTVGLINGRARRTVAVCTGTFALAAAGLLDGRRAATHWRHADALSREFPAVKVDYDALYVQEDRVFTSAGITAGIDVALALVEDDIGAEAARIVARILVVFMQRAGGQSQFSARAMAGSIRNDSLRAVLDAVVSDPTAEHSLSRMAARAGFSVRHLSRLFDEQVGMTAGHYVEHVRVEAAKNLLENGDDTIDVIAARSGFRSSETMRRAFVRETGLSPAAYRVRSRQGRTPMPHGD